MKNLEKLSLLMLITTQLASVDRTKPVYSYPLHKAAELGCHRLIRHYINSGEYLIDSSDECGRTPLHWAAIVGRLRTVEVLLELDAEIEVRDGMGKLPEDYAKNKVVKNFLKEWRKLEFERLKKRPHF